ncbi:site-specific integrase [Pontibacter populi]|uniref:Site-specific integrase n=1 Tax=Pontibacter populi TaxID=890055 RepID=A0ABV1RXF6_9BACT
MSVLLRKKPITKGRYSIYLDYYSEGERRYEFLHMYIFKRPKDAIEKQHNKETTRLAESIRSKRDLELNTTDHGFQPNFKKGINFIEYFEKYASSYTKKNTRSIQGSLNHFKKFIGKDKLSAKLVTEQLCNDFKDYLNSNLNGETPYDYFTVLKRVLKQATRDKIIPFSPAAEIVNKKTEGIKKDILTTTEIQTLAQTECGNNDVKRAFLFACVTGLRYCDIKTLKWSHINDGSLKITQSKTQKPVIVNLNTTAIKLLGEAQESAQPIFTLPSHTGISKSLKTWAKRAKLKKHVTFHCARHSFATNLIIYETDINTVSSLLGHTSLSHTQKYVRVVEALKRQAVNKLPEINI